MKDYLKENLIPVQFGLTHDKLVTVFLKRGRIKAWCEGSGNMEILKR